LRKVSKKCQDYGIRVQNSVFECTVDSTQLTLLRHDLLEIINPEEDSLRIYKLGSKQKNKVEHIGNKTSLDVESSLIF
jgi:CRISPR-associated protein Cas2